ncbi:hypothetical protein KY385_00880 [Candidatus Parcubacteria bacterium]|nr:hypothetical protein [Candidatus Parcubacteria bacterium]
MPPFYFTAEAGTANRLTGELGAERVKTYPTFQAQDWMRGAHRQIQPNFREEGDDQRVLDILANEVVDTVLTGGELIQVEAEDAEELARLAIATETVINPVNQ